MVALSKGNDITVASSITPTHDVHRLTSTGTINTINTPSPSFCGFVILIFDNAGISFGTSGNIEQVNLSYDNKVSYMFVYDPSSSKWHFVT